MLKVITIGAAVKDVFLTPADVPIVKNKKLFESGSGLCFDSGKKYEAKEIFYDTGGGATNAAATLRLLGVSCGIHTVVGNDVSGKDVLEDLKKRGVKMSSVKIDKNKGTGFSVILQFPSGERSIVVYRGASSDFNYKDLHAGSLQANWFYLTNVKANIQFIDKVFAIAKKNKVKVFWNPGGAELRKGVVALKKYLLNTEVFSLNREEAEILTGNKDLRKMLGMLSELVKIVVITDGKDGAYLASLSDSYFVPSSGTKPLNTTGAGDAFNSGFLAGLIKLKDWKEAVKVGVWNSDGVIQEMGAKHGLISELPSSSQMKKIVISDF